MAVPLYRVSRYTFWQMLDNSLTNTPTMLTNKLDSIAHQWVDEADVSWKQEIASSICNTHDLLSYLELSLLDQPDVVASVEDFPMRVPKCFVKRMKKRDWNDPLLKQVLTQAKEMDIVPGFNQDPLEETNHNPVPGLIHKYHGRVLLIISGGCAINCRYCFRRHFPYGDNQLTKDHWQAIVRYIASDSSVEEVIFSGGDPLMASDKRLAQMVDSIASIPHVQRLRIHSRLPVVIPQRITSACLNWLTSTRLKPIMVIHCNHANEIDSGVIKAMHQLNDAGVMVLNQLVLLRDINDTVSALKNLCEALFAHHVMPYYMYLLDRVKGAAHFQVDEMDARKLLGGLLRSLPGYLVPRLVKEIPYRESKTHIIHA